MKNVYLKKTNQVDNKYFTALNDTISIDVYPTTIDISSNPLSLQGYDNMGYIECTREEFMEYYIPINKRMNELTAIL